MLLVASVFTPSGFDGWCYFCDFFVKPDTFSGLGVQRVDSDAQAAFL